MKKIFLILIATIISLTAFGSFSVPDELICSNSISNIWRIRPRSGYRYDFYKFVGSTWTPVGDSAITVSPSDTGSYMVVEFNFSTFHRDTAYTHLYLINISAGTIIGNDSVCVGSTISFIDTTIVGYYFWNVSNTNLSITTTSSGSPITMIARADSIGLDTVIMISSSGGSECFDTTYKIVWINDCGINSVISINKPELSISPNPAFDYVNINFVGKFNVVMIFDMSGRAMYNSNVLGDNTIIDIRYFPSGVYCIMVNGLRFRLIKD